MLTKLHVVSITVTGDLINLLLESTNHQGDLLPETLGWVQIFTDVKYFFAILIKQSLSVRQNFIDFVIHLSYLGYILVIIVFNDVHNFFLLFIQSIPNFIDISIGFLD